MNFAKTKRKLKKDMDFCDREHQKFKKRNQDEINRGLYSPQIDLNYHRIVHHKVLIQSLLLAQRFFYN
jgi:hypothetical protein